MPDTVRTDVTGAPVTQLYYMLANKRLLSSHYRYGVFGNTAGYGGLEVQPVRHGAWRARGLRRGARDMGPAARAPHLMPVVLDGLRARLGQVGDLVGVPDPEITGPGQVPAAPAGALREVRDGAVRVIVPRQVRPRRPGLLTGPPLRPALPLPGLRRFPPGLVIAARRHRGVAAVAGDQPLQPGDLLRLLRNLSPQASDHCVLVLVQQPEPLNRLPQPRVLRAQLSGLRPIRRTGHTGTTSRPTPVSESAPSAKMGIDRPHDHDARATARTPIE